MDDSHAQPRNNHTHLQVHSLPPPFPHPIQELAETRPDKMTFINMDQPTKDQLEIPVQPRQYRDVAKSVENAPGWASKMMGCMIASVGMLCFVAHARLDGGANFTCTSVDLTLLFMVANGCERSRTRLSVPAAA